MERFTDKNYYLSDFLDEVLVHCPACDEKATVINDSNKAYVELSCTACGEYKKNDKTYYRLEFRRNCPDCGKEITLKIDKVGKKKDSMKIPCRSCGFTENYTPKYTQYQTMYGDIKNGKEYFFNADLWLQKPYKNHLFWATNYRHLAYLKAYIQSKIRTRGACGYIDYHWNMTMVAKLPQFIKSGKNREKLLKITEQLKNK